jgi:hypothetical protein
MGRRPEGLKQKAEEEEEEEEELWSYLCVDVKLVSHITVKTKIEGV